MPEVIVGLVGSLRKQSFNRKLMQACVRLVDARFELRYVPHEQNQGEPEREIAEDDLTTAYYREGALDVIEMLREQFQLALPMKPLCAESCRGLCPECGANLNRANCGCNPKWVDPRLAPLKALLNGEKEK